MEVKIAVEKRIIEQIANELTKIIKPVAMYDNNIEIYLKNVIAEQTERAIIIADIVTKIQDGQFFNEVDK